ncbi:hypothetical protein CYMTET_10147 [Cymbomonas tetramitiformis]|uniref:Uncharacterized protein n=1 Tax=Cymbomonas tetramitiformis TaxID=36881 RepID=A0AAE0GQB8_9CHLO|nr:hypothetical protein CYMTET_10147 [Cymbomonas tetramitiformis]
MTEDEIDKKKSMLVGKFKKAAGWKEVGKTVLSPTPSNVSNLISGSNVEEEADDAADKNDDEEDAEEEEGEAEYDLESHKGAEDEQDAESEEEAEEALTQDQHAGICSPEGATPTQTPTKSDPPTRDPESAKRIRAMLDAPYEPESVQHLLGDREEQAAMVKLVRVAVKSATKDFKKLRTKLTQRWGSWKLMPKAVKKSISVGSFEGKASPLFNLPVS